MPIQQQSIDEFKRIYHDDYGEDITDAEALAMGTRLVDLVRLLLDPDMADA